MIEIAPLSTEISRHANKMLQTDGRTDVKTYRLRSGFFEDEDNKQLSYRRETALQGGLVMAKSGRLYMGDNILLTL